jgi:pimeloyl-ACP methyl ester carboxylesterase
VKSIIITAAFVLGNSISYGQLTIDKYSKAKEIIKGLDSIATPDGIQESYFVNIGGIKQWVNVRGHDINNPIILFVHGGPASPMSPITWMYQKPFEEFFTIVHYDQRASGKTYVANDTMQLGNTINIEQYIDDAIELSEFIKSKYKKKKLILVGHSWGTVIAMKSVLKKPELYYAYVGIGQVINSNDNERYSFDFATDQATKTKNETALKELQSIAPYPGNKPITRERIIIARKWAQYYGGLSAFKQNSNYYFDAPLLSPDYTKKDVDAIDNGSLFTLSRILPSFLNIDFKSVKQFPIPIFMFMGRHDYTTPSQPTSQWLENLTAPIKKGIWFENSAHLIPLEEPGKMLISLLNDVKPVTLK